MATVIILAAKATVKWSRMREVRVRVRVRGYREEVEADEALRLFVFHMKTNILTYFKFVM